MNLIDEIRSTITGAAVINDWLGAGGIPVADWQAEARASVCEHCPLNREPFWWEKSKTKVAQTIKSHLAIKGKLGFIVFNESRLGICKPCGCVLPLKVWTPIQHLREHTTPEIIQKLPQTNCWLRTELEAPE